MSKAEKFIQDCTRNCSNELCAVEDRFGKKVISYNEWLTPDQARRAVEIAREEAIEPGEPCDLCLKELVPVYRWLGREAFLDKIKKGVKASELLSQFKEAKKGGTKK